MKRTKKGYNRLLAGVLAGVIGFSAAGLNVQAEDKDPLDALSAGAAVYLEAADTEVQSRDWTDAPNEGQEDVSEQSNTENGRDEQQVQKELPDRLHAGAAVYLGASGGVLTGMESDTDDTQQTDGDQTDIDTLVMANVKDSLNVRAAADEEADAVGKLFEGCGGEILERADGWTKLRSGKLEGWAKDEYLLFGEEAAKLRQEAGALTATITTDALRVRKEADSEAGIYGLVGIGDEFEVTEQTDEWVTIRYEEDKIGYIAADFAQVAFKVPAGKTKQEIADEERAKELAKLSKNQGAVPTSVSDVQLLAALIQCEAGTQPYEGKLAVGAAVMNRVRSGGYPNSIMAVITAPGQFPPATNGKVASVAASGPSASCMQAAQEAVNGATNIGGATHFNRVGAHDGIVIGGHVFW